MDNDQPSPVPCRPDLASDSELSRLIAAALVDQNFCQLLLTDPAAAIESSFGDETFQLTPAEKETVLQIKHATSLVDFARQVSERYYNISP